MKKLLGMMVSTFMVVSLVACNATTNETESNTNESTSEGKTLVVYYSASGNTEAIANMIAEQTHADVFELEPVQAYSNEDLDWTVEGSRVNLEHDDESLRDIELVSTSVENWDEYDTVYIGYPIWWAIAAWPVNNFVLENDFSDKTVIPFATATSSGIGESGELLAEMAGSGNWLDGEIFRRSSSADDVSEWIASLGL